MRQTWTSAKQQQASAPAYVENCKFAAGMLQALRQSNVKVVLINPGPIATSMTEVKFLVTLYDLACDVCCW